MNDFAMQRRMRRQQSGRRRPLVLLFFAFFFLFLSYKGITMLFGSTKNEVKVLLGESTKKSENLQNVIDPLLSGSSGSYAIFIKNLKTGESYSFNEHRHYDTASLYKLWVMGTAFERIQKGTLDENQEIKEDIEVLNEKFSIASESAELTEGSLELSVHDALEKMITISDNYSALLLAWKLRLSTIAAYLQRHGFLESKVGVHGDSPTSTASDIGLFFEKLYKGELGDSRRTTQMLDLLKRQRLNEKLPKYLPETVSIAHKTGELGEFSHDAGIVYTPGGDYIIVVLTETNAPADAVVRISKISSAIYSYFTQ